MSKALGALMEPLKVFIISRSLLLLLLIVSSQITLTAIPGLYGNDYHASFSTSSLLTKAHLSRLWSMADAGWYINIAQNGYAKAPFTDKIAYNWTLFPLYPLLLKVTGLTGINIILRGVLLSNLCLLGSLILLNVLGDKFSLTDKEKKLSLWLAAFHPTAYFYSAPLTESLFLLLLLGTFLALEREAYFFAGLLMGLSTATRVQGLLALPAFCLKLLEKKSLFSIKGIVAMIIAPLGIASFSGYLFAITGEPLAWLKNQAAWGREVPTNATPLARLLAESTNLVLPWNFCWLNVMAVAVAFFGSVLLARKRQYSYALLVATPVFVALSTGTALSFCRFTMTSFPLFLVYGKVLIQQKLDYLALVVAGILFALLTVMYALHITAAMA